MVYNKLTHSLKYPIPDLKKMGIFVLFPYCSLEITTKNNNC